MTSCSVFQEIMAGLDLTYKMGFTERLPFGGQVDALFVLACISADCSYQEGRQVSEADPNKPFTLFS
jgi:hypothetical protein